MIVTADASFLASLYGVDVNTPAARAWMAANAEPVILTGALRFETENALRLACFRGRITAVELAQAGACGYRERSRARILIATDITADVHWAECSSISARHTLSTGSRTYDITHVASARVLKADAFLSFDERQRTLAGLLGLKVAP
jgi:predicted nucleic acid-binding protein